jgi:hypothetical protein
MQKFRYTLRKEGHGLLDEPLYHCLTNRLIGIELPALQSSSLAQTRDSHTGRDEGCKECDSEHPSQNGAGCPVLRGQHVGVRYRGA